MDHCERVSSLRKSFGLIYFSASVFLSPSCGHTEVSSTRKDGKVARDQKVCAFDFCCLLLILVSLEVIEGFVRVFSVFLTKSNL